MRVRRLSSRTFRGVLAGHVDLPQLTLLVGSNNVGESIVCEALEVALGP